MTADRLMALGYRFRAWLKLGPFWQWRFVRRGRIRAREGPQIEWYESPFRTEKVDSGLPFIVFDPGYIDGPWADGEQVCHEVVGFSHRFQRSVYGGRVVDDTEHPEPEDETGRFDWTGWVADV